MAVREASADIIVVGCGASGLMAAIQSARAGRRVLVLDHHQTPAKKLLATGNGRCNFTNKMQGSECYRCGDPAFVLPVLEQFSAEDAIAFFEELGVLTTERQGYCYPRSKQASAVRDALLAEAKRLRVTILNEVGIRGITKENGRFCVAAKSGDFYAGKCILAAGGKASPGTGSDGSGYIYAENLGHRIIPPLPALVALTGKADWLKMTAGVRCDAAVTLRVGGVRTAFDAGEVQMTDYGISGIPVFQVSRFASAALAQGIAVRADLDFLPDQTKEHLRELLCAQYARRGREDGWEEIVSGMVNRKIAAMICRHQGLSQDSKRSLTEQEIAKQAESLSGSLKETRLTITGTRGFRQAQATCGGICVDQICARTMESKIVPGLYFAGEIVDVDGICGGYNLQWAWSSGYAAGRAAASGH